MGESTGIAWTHHTYNPWWGCTRVSPGCEHCYAEAFSKRVGLKVWGPTRERRFFADGHWQEPLSWNEKAKRDGVRRRVFCASMADVFEDRPELAVHRARLFALIDQTPELDWLLLTKRPENASRLWSDAERDSGATFLPGGSDREMWAPNIWLGATVEDQRRANERIYWLLSTPARIRFLSCEPLLEPVDLASFLPPRGPHVPSRTGQARIDWVIIGGESGSHARPFDTGWALDLIDQCKAHGVAPFFKQAGAVPKFRGYPMRLKDRKGGDPEEWPEMLRVREFPALEVA